MEEGRHEQSLQLPGLQSPLNRSGFQVFPVLYVTVGQGPALAAQQAGSEPSTAALAGEQLPTLCLLISKSRVPATHPKTGWNRANRNESSFGMTLKRYRTAQQSLQGPARSGTMPAGTARTGRAGESQHQISE